MNSKKLLPLIITSILLYNCAPKPTITLYCEKDPKNNYILKWEIFPESENTPVEIFSSDNDSIFPSEPVLTASLNDYIAVINNEDESMQKRKFFRIRVGNAISDIVSNRFFEMDSIQNFRDIGGYTNTENKQVRWGKLYRSGSFTKLTKDDSMELSALGIRTIIDMRSNDVKKQNLDKYKTVNNVRLPIALSGYNSISQQIMEDRFLRGDAIIHTQDLYRDMVTNFASEYAAFFDYLCDESNYPIAFHCHLGKDQSGLATYLLLKILDVPIETIEEDYLASNIGIDRSKLVKGARNLSESKQEALTMMTKTDISYLRYSISCIREKSGSVDEYILNELKVTPEKKQQLKNILLH